jgi:hypothetical protein
MAYDMIKMGIDYVYEHVLRQALYSSWHCDMQPGVFE